jgi:type VI secretion system lysozyme-like protein
MPDFSSLSALSGDDRERISALVTRAITAFEPRLSGARVTAERLRTNDRALILRLDASLVIGEYSEPVSFSLVARPGAGEIDVSEGDEY